MTRLLFGKRLRGSLLARALATNLVLLGCTGVLVSGIFLFAMRRVVLGEMDLRASSLAKFVATRAEFSMLVGDFAELRLLAQETLSMEDVLFVVITNEDGIQVRVARPGFPDEDIPESVESEAIESRGARAGYTQAEHPIERPDARELLGLEHRRSTGQPSIGSVRVGLSLEQPRTASLAATSKALVVAAMCVVTILMVQSRQLRRLLAPLRSLADFTARFGRGNLDGRAEVVGTDEIAELAASFNAMLDRLADTLVSKDLAEQANMAKGRFLASASHELRTPLNAIIGYSELLEEECLERGQIEALADLNKIRNSGRMLLELVNDLLDYSKAEAGRTQLALETVSVAAVMQEVADTTRPLALTNGNCLMVEAPPDAVMVHADRCKFRQSLLNLASNACKFTERGTITLSADGGDSVCRIRVRDTGIGIAADELDRLFQAFVQLDSAATRKYNGTGLGLAVSRRFCRMMGGDITVESQPGRGSTFTISLPVAKPISAP